jgi:large subunit ribosomal protein L4
VRVPVHNLTGEVVDHIDVSDQVFAVPANEAVVHQVLVAQRANARQGTASTKTRNEVRGSSGKLFRQKGTGYARAGSIRSPIRRGGGITFGPKPRDYHQTIPKKMRRLALRCVLSAKARDNELVLLERLELGQPSTKEIAKILAALGVASSTLIVTAEPEAAVVKAARNLPGVGITPASLLNVVDILSHKMLLMTVPAVRKAEELWGGDLAKRGSDEPLSSVTTSADN